MSAAADLALPPALAAWGDLFSAMPGAHRALLATLVAELSPLVERAEAAGSRPRGEVDSYSGIGTRGGVERLLGSEWLWRDLAPDDFLRRVAEREALTLEPVHRPAADARTVLVAIDAGPLMLGRPRLVAFAALVCLAASARGRGARLLWWSNAVPDGPWREAFTRADVAALLDGVSAVPLDAETLRRRLEAPPPGRARGPRPTAWIIGPAAGPEAPPGAGRVSIAEVPRLDPDLVVAARVEVLGPGGRAASAIFDLPGEAEATALLRDPFRAAAPARPEPTPPLAARPGWAQSCIAFANEGDYLVVAMRDGLLLMPSSHDGERPIYRVPLPPFERLLGVDVALDRLSYAVLTRYTTRARVILREAMLSTEAPALKDVFTTFIDSGHPLAVGPWPRTALPPLGRPGRRERCWVMTPDGEAFVLSAEGAQRYAPLSAGRILAACQDAILVERRDGTIIAGRRTDGRTLARFAPPSSIAKATTFDFVRHEDECWMVMARSDGTWRLARGKHPPIQIPAEIEGQITVAVVSSGAAAEVPALVMLDEEGSYRLCDSDFADIVDPVEVEKSLPDLVAAARCGEGEAWLATAHCDEEGFAASLTHDSFHTSCHAHRDVSGIAEMASCLRA